MRATSGGRQNFLKETDREETERERERGAFLLSVSTLCSTVRSTANQP